jgi:DNA-binding GntR family transcriptional regulator
MSALPRVPDRAHRPSQQPAPAARSSTRSAPGLTRIAPPAALVDQAYDALLDAIVSGELRPDVRYTQEGLALRLGVSRQPVLQALLLLRRQGLIKDEPGRHGIELTPMSPDFVQQLYSVRGALDGLAARSAACRPRPELRKPGRELIRAGQDAARAGDITALVDADLAFHRFIDEAADNPLLTETAAIHWLHTRRTMASYLRQVGSVKSVWREHQAILDAVVKGDARLAEHLAREHCEHSLQIILHSLQPHPDPGGDHETDPRTARAIRP